MLPAKLYTNTGFDATMENLMQGNIALGKL